VKIALRGPTDWVLSLPEDGNRSGFRNAMLYLKLEDGLIPRRKDYVNKCGRYVQVEYARNKKHTNVFVGKRGVKLPHRIFEGKMIRRNKSVETGNLR
jgi:hypothetical protein